MGNDQSTPEDSGLSSFSQRLQKDFVFVREKKDPRFGDIQIYKEKGHDKYIFLKGHWCGDEENYNQFLRQCNKRIKINHPNVLRMIGFNQHSETQICGDFSKINCYYEYFSLNLEKELDKRLPEQKYFTEPEIWYIIDSIVNACSFFESNKIYHGDIRPINVLLTVSGQIKIADNGIVNQSKNGYIKALFDGETPYLSPLLMNALANKERKPSHNQFKSDVYSLGMTMLECCMLYRSQSFYDFSSCELRYNLIEDFLNRARLMYSGFLVNLIREMLNREEFQRPTFHEISAILAPYKQQIQSLTPFSADYITVKQNFVHPDQQLILQSGVTTNPNVFYQLNQSNHQGINLLNQSLSVVQTSPALSTVKYSPDKSYLAHSKLVFQQSGAPTNFTQSIVTPQPNQSYHQVATPAVFSPAQSTINYQMSGVAQQQPIQQNQQVQQQGQLQQQSALLPQPGFQQQNQQITQQPNQINNQFGQLVMVSPTPANPNSQYQSSSVSTTNPFGILSNPPSQLASQQQPGQSTVIQQQQPPQINYTTQYQQPVQQIPLTSVQSQQQNIPVSGGNTENTPHNQQMNTQSNNAYTPSNANNSQLAYSPINLIYQNPQQITEKPFSVISTTSNNQQQLGYQPVQPFQIQNNQPSQNGTGSTENLQNNSSANSAQFVQLQSQQPQQQEIPASLYQQQSSGISNGQSVQDSIQQAINYSNSVLQRNPNF